MTQFPFSSGSQFFTSPNVGYVAGLYGYISKTTDGGTTWHYLTTGVSNYLSCLYFPTAQIGFAAGHNIIIKTNDSGGSWSVKYTGQLQFNSIFFTDSLNGYAMDANPYEIAMLKTLDGGETWTPVTPSLTNYPLSYVFFTNPDTGYIVGYNGVILKTSTGGLSTGESN